MSKWPFVGGIFTIAVLAFTFDPITIALIIKGLVALGAAVAVGAAVHIAYLTISEIWNWFRNHRHLSNRDSRIVGVTIKEAMQQGKYVVVQGIFNSRSGKMLEARRIKSDHLDSELASNHYYQKRVIYDLN